MACTKEEIERKRLAALQRRQFKISSHNSTGSTHTVLGSSIKWSAAPVSPSPSLSTSAAGPVKSFGNQGYRTHHPYAKPENYGSPVPVTKVVSGTVYLISEDRFEVNPSEFCAPLINIFKTISSRNYDSQSKLWNFSINEYQELMSKVAPLSPHVVLGPIPSYVFKILQRPLLDPTSIDLSPIESTLRHKLMPFQEEGVRFGISRRGRCMIADDMGLGKTFQALAIASYYRQDWPLLIVTTSSMRETWQSKIHELLPSVPLMNIVTLSNSKDTQLVADKQTEVVIVSYKIAGMHTQLLKDKKFGVVIIDESHYLKSPKAQCTIALGGCCRNAARRILLSGTPALSRPCELYTQLAVIDRGLFPGYTEYGKRYCAGKQTNFGWDMSGQSNAAELRAILSRLIIRRTKEQVLTHLEGKTRETVILDQSLLEYSKEDQEGLSELARAYRSRRAADRHAALVTYFAETARVKIPAVCKYIKQMMSSEEGKVLIFAHHRCMVEAVCAALDEAATRYICIVGATPPNTRQDLVDRFQHKAQCRAAVLSVTAAGAGITLTAAGLVIFAELHWNPGVLSQAESRAHRLGRCGSVRVRYLLAPHSADDHMWPLLQEKLNVLNDVGLSKDTYEDTTTRHQESNSNITQYLTPSPGSSRSDFIPGTNIRRNSLSKAKANDDKEKLSNDFCDSFNISDLNCEQSDCADKSFLDDDEDDELMANLDL